MDNGCSTLVFFYYTNINVIKAVITIKICRTMWPYNDEAKSDTIVCLSQSLFKHNFQKHVQERSISFPVKYLEVRQG